MKARNILKVNEKIKGMEVLKEEVIEMLPKTSLSKTSFNRKQKRKEVMHYFDMALALANESDIFVPDDNYMILMESVRILERGIVKQREILKLCYFANAFGLCERAQLEFDEAAYDNDKDRCLILIADEKRRQAEVERVTRSLEIRIQKRNKEVYEIEQLLSQWLDEDGCPRFKSVNVGNMNTYLMKLYPKDSIIEAYKQFLDTEPFNALMRAIERDLDKRYNKQN